jgi:tetratricopeptide (TPR) repeat protein
LVVVGSVARSHDPAELARAREAERQLREQLKNDETSRGSDHPSLCATLVRLGVVVAKQGRAAEAELLVERALRISQPDGGTTVNAATAQIWIVLAQIQAVLRKPGAASTARRALQGLNATLGADHATSKNARPVLERIIEMDRRSSSSSVEELTEELEEGVDALRAHDAEGSIEMLIPVADKARDAKAPAVESYARGMLAQALFLAGKREAALSEVRRALDIAEKSGHVDAAKHFRELLVQLEAAESGAKAAVADYNERIRAALERAHKGDPEAAFRELNEIARAARQGGAAGPEASARIVLGQIYLARKDKASARTELGRALEIAELVGDKVIAGHVQKLLAAADR